MRGPYYLIETLQQAPHLEDKIKIEQDERKLKGMRTMGTFVVGMFASMGAWLGADVYDTDQALMRSAVENNSTVISVVVGTKIVTDAVIATYMASTMAEFGSFASQAHHRLSEVRAPRFDQFVEK